MKVHGDIESVNLQTGERWQRVVGDGESVLVSSLEYIPPPRLGPRQPTPEEVMEEAKEFADKVSQAIQIQKEKAMDKVQIAVWKSWNGDVPLEVQICSEPMDRQDAKKIIEQLDDVQRKLWDVARVKYVLVRA